VSAWLLWRISDQDLLRQSTKYVTRAMTLSSKQSVVRSMGIMIMVLFGVVCCVSVVNANNQPNAHYKFGFYDNSPITEIANSKQLKDLIHKDTPYFVKFYSNRMCYYSIIFQLKELSSCYIFNVPA
jgi:hypothetical protein